MDDRVDVVTPEALWQAVETDLRQMVAGVAGAVNRQVKQASEIWSAQVHTNGHGLIAAHNLAVLHHVAAMDEESQAASNRFDSKRAQRLASTWLQALCRWREVLEGEDFWTQVRQRVREINDVSLSTGLVRRMRNTMPRALLLINATMAVEAAERQDSDSARRHVQILQESNYPSALADTALRDSLQPLRTRIKIAVDHAKSRWTENPRYAAQAVRNLHKQSLVALAIVDAVLPADRAGAGAMAGGDTGGVGRGTTSGFNSTLVTEAEPADRGSDSLRTGFCVAAASFDSGQYTMTSEPSLRKNERLMRENSSSGFRLFICYLTRRRHVVAIEAIVVHCEIGTKVVHHARRVVFQMAEVAIPRTLFATILRRIERLRLLCPSP